MSVVTMLLLEDLLAFLYGAHEFLLLLALSASLVVLNHGSPGGVLLLAILILADKDIFSDLWNRLAFNT